MIDKLFVRSRAIPVTAKRFVLALGDDTFAAEASVADTKKGRVLIVSRTDSLDYADRKRLLDWHKLLGFTLTDQVLLPAGAKLLEVSIDVKLTDALDF